MIRLLIADDEKLEREALAELVQRRFEREVVLEVAENGRKAADTAVLWGADLILMDIEMPGMSGLDAARAVLAQRPSCRVIFVTAYSLFQYAHEAVHLGAVAGASGITVNASVAAPPVEIHPIPGRQYGFGFYFMHFCIPLPDVTTL